MQVSIISTFLGPEHEGLPKLAKIGFRLVEIERGAAASADVRALKGLLDRNGMAVSCLMGADHGIAEKDATTRKDRIEKLKGSVKRAVELGAKVVETVPMWHGPAEERRAALEHAVESYKVAGKFAADHGVVLAIEPVNRAETKLVHTLAQAVAMAKAVDLPSVRSNGYCFLVEMKYRAWRSGFRLVEVPIVFVERRVGGSKLGKRVILEAAWKPWALRLRTVVGKEGWRQTAPRSE